MQKWCSQVSAERGREEEKLVSGLVDGRAGYLQVDSGRSQVSRCCFWCVARSRSGSATPCLQQLQWLPCYPRPVQGTSAQRCARGSTVLQRPASQMGQGKEYFNQRTKLQLCPIISTRQGTQYCAEVRFASFFSISFPLLRCSSRRSCKAQSGSR